MGVTCITGMWGPKAQAYADMFVGPWRRGWSTAHLVLYTEDVNIGRVEPTRIWQRDMTVLPGWEDFVARHRDNVERNGRLPRPSWKASALDRGYNWKFDAVRFAGQGFIPDDAAARLPDGEVMVWLDADVVTLKAVPMGWPETLMRGETDGLYLGRHQQHSEIGFWAVRLNATTRAMVAELARLYRSDELFELDEWHSAFVWDEARRRTGAKLLNLAPAARGHVWPYTPLRTYLDHRKGDRKGAFV